MVGFGLDNVELGTKIAPFMFALFDNLDHELRVVVGVSVLGEPTGTIDLDEWPPDVRANIENDEVLQDMIASMGDVWGSTEDVWEIRFDGYALFMERDESYTAYDDYEVREGRWLVEFSRSRLLDDLRHYTFADDSYPGPLSHFGVYCEDHLIDVITDAAPAVRKLNPTEIRALGITGQGRTHTRYFTSA